MPSRVVIVVFDDVMSLDAFGPLEAFTAANDLLAGQGRAAHYDVSLVSADGAPVTCSSGPTLQPAGALPSLDEKIDTVIVAGGDGTRSLMDANPVTDWLAAVKPRRLASVCSGALVLAAAGRLDGRSATTHWLVCDLLARRYPNVEVLTDPIFVRDGNVITSAGVTAGMDLTISLIEEDLGPELALDVARALVMFVRRPGGQSQFSVQLSAPPSSTASVRTAQDLIASDPAADLSVAALAAQVALSERHFARLFRAETGHTVARYVEASRLEAARRLLETSDMSIDAVATGSGFPVADTFRRVFQRRLGVTPSEYRSRFRTTVSMAS